MSDPDIAGNGASFKFLDMAKKRFGQFSAIIAADNNPLFSLKVKHQPNLNHKNQPNQAANDKLNILVLYSFYHNRIHCSLNTLKTLSNKHLHLASTCLIEYCRRQFCSRQTTLIINT